MQEMIIDRRSTGKKFERQDLFSRLLEANSEENAGSDSLLKDSELRG